MQESGGRNDLAFLAGIVIGAIAGAAATLALAPASGEETRDKLRQQGVSFEPIREKATTIAATSRDKAADVAHTVQDKATGIAETGKQKAADVAHTVQDKLPGHGSDVDATAEKVSDTVSDGVDDLRRKASNAVDDAGDKADSDRSIGEKAKDALNDARDKVSDKVSSDRDAGDKAKDKAEDVRDDVSDAAKKAADKLRPN